MVGGALRPSRPRKLLGRRLIVAGSTLLVAGRPNLRPLLGHLLAQLLQGGHGAALRAAHHGVDGQIRPSGIGYATSLFNLMRKWAARRHRGHRHTTSRAIVSRRRGPCEHVTAYDPTSQAMMAQMKAAFMAAGADA